MGNSRQHRISSLALGQCVRDPLQLLDRRDPLAHQLSRLDRPDAGDAREEADGDARVVASDFLELSQFSCKMF